MFRLPKAFWRVHRATVGLALGLTVIAPAMRPALAGLDSCLAAAYQGADPSQLELAAKFAADHSICLQNLVPPEPLIPYAALSGSMDAANKAGLLGKVGLDFGNDYNVCVSKFDVGKTTIKKLEPVLKPICSTIHMSCDVFESQGAGEINAQATSEFPILGMLPCGCAAATSGLGVDRLVELVKKARDCGSAVADIAKDVGHAASSIYSAGKSVAEGAVCTIESIWGGCDEQEPAPPPPTGISEATKWCAPYGGLKAAMSKSNQPNDYSVVCNDSSACIVSPGKKPNCLTAAQKKKGAEARAARDAKTRQENLQWAELRRAQWRNDYETKCHDTKCKQSVEFTLGKFLDEVIKQANDPNATFPAIQIAFLKEKASLKVIEGEINDSIVRDPNVGFQTKLEAYGCKYFLGRALEGLCPIGAPYALCKSLVDQNLMRVCYQENTSNSKYANKIMDDPTAEPHARMALWGCKSFMGRANQELCQEDKGFQICKEAADKGWMQECIHSVSGARYAPKVTHVALPDQPAEKWLPQDSCKPFMGRPGEWLCPTVIGYSVCARYITMNTVDVCTAPNVPRRISMRFIDKEVAKWGCSKGGTQGGPVTIGMQSYTCANTAAVDACNKIKADYQNPGSIQCEEKKPVQLIRPGVIVPSQPPR